MSIKDLVKEYKSDFDKYEAHLYSEKYVRQAKRLFVKWCLLEMTVLKHYHNNKK